MYYLIDWGTRDVLFMAEYKETIYKFIDVEGLNLKQDKLIICKELEDN
jgi:hypothetical protein